MSIFSEYFTSSPEETIFLGEQLAKKFGYGAIITLDASLGGGKTVLAKGLAHGWGITDTDYVTSPTFTLINRYEGTQGFVYHIDLYRLSDAREAVDIGILEILESGSSVIIEWPERIATLLPDTTIRINITTHSITERKIIVQPYT